MLNTLRIYVMYIIFTIIARRYYAELPGYISCIHVVLSYTNYHVSRAKYTHKLCEYFYICILLLPWSRYSSRCSNVNLIELDGSREDYIHHDCSSLPANDVSFQKFKKKFSHDIVRYSYLSIRYHGISNVPWNSKFDKYTNIRKLLFVLFVTE